ncbi:MAG: hypothetical protein WDN02_10340 [Methylovirgula sp.]|uniref:hypothetical protein n=1 Tax=Methylovirgula sp. TaxID=1978224 RepID=UPI003075F5E9
MFCSTFFSRRRCSPLSFRPTLRPNERNVAGAIDKFTNAGGTVSIGFNPLYNLSAVQLGNAVTQLSGEASTALITLPSR